MQQLDAATLKAMAAELSLLLDGAKVSKVQHPSAHEFLITFWGGAERRNDGDEARNILYIHLNPEMPFCALISNRQRQETVLSTFDKPTALCMLLRKHLNGANLIDVKALPGERVLDLVFENFNELGNKVRLVLSLELMGKHSNMIFYDDVQGSILAVAHGVSEKMSSVRELAAGLPYARPPHPPGKRLLSELTADEFAQLWQSKKPEEDPAVFLNQRLAGWGLNILRSLLSELQEPREIYRVLSRLDQLNGLSSVISSDGETFALLPTDRSFEGQCLNSVNSLMHACFLKKLQGSRLKRHREQLLLRLLQQMKKWERREKELVPVAEEEVECWQATGDRLLAALSAREVNGERPLKGVASLTDYVTGEPQTIAVDPALTWVENAQTYYRRAQKAKGKKANYDLMAEKLQEEKNYLDTLRQLVSQADTLAELEALAIDLQATEPNGKKTTDSSRPFKRKTETPSGIMHLKSSDGQDIWVGKSGQGNEVIVGKLSRSDDIWLHVHQMPGSHVLLRPGAEGMSPQALLEAATLAVWYSSARNSLNVPVIYTQCKYVRKIPHSYPGHVNYREEQTVFITPDPQLIQRLLSQ